MANLKNDRKKLIILILIFSIILFFMYNLSKAKNDYNQEDLIFFKLLGSNNFKNSSDSSNDSDKANMQSKTSSQENTKKVQEYKFKISKNNFQSKEINLLQTIDAKTLVNEKVAPGTEGNFNIILSSNSNLEYEIKLIGKNNKPQNLVFQVQENMGTIEKGETKIVPVKWKWEYKTNEDGDKQDTNDGENIEKYNFEICTIGR